MRRLIDGLLTLSVLQLTWSILGLEGGTDVQRTAAVVGVLAILAWAAGERR